MTNLQIGVGFDLTILAWMLVASDEATAGSVIPKHDLLRIRLSLFQKVQMVSNVSHQSFKTCAWQTGARIKQIFHILANLFWYCISHSFYINFKL